jgi:hypothetical protein
LKYLITACPCSKGQDISGRKDRTFSAERYYSKAEKEQKSICPVFPQKRERRRLSPSRSVGVQFEQIYRSRIGIFKDATYWQAGDRE